MMKLVLPCCDLEIKTDKISSDENKEKAYILFDWTTKNTFIKSLVWWNYKDIPTKSVGTWKAKVVCEGWEREFMLPSLDYCDTLTMTGDWLVYDSILNNCVLVSEDGCFEIKFKRKKRAPIVPNFESPYAGHDVEYQVKLTLNFDDIPEPAKALVDRNMEKKKASDDVARRRQELKRRAAELLKMAEELV